MVVQDLIERLQQMIKVEPDTATALIWFEWAGRYFQVTNGSITPIRYAPDGSFGITVGVKKIHDD